jgi:hypothetical protein
VVAAVEAGARAGQRAAGARLGGLQLVVVVDREVVGLADLDHRREAIGLEIGEAVLVAGHQAQREAAVGEARPGGAGRGQPVLDRVDHPRRGVAHPRRQRREQRRAAALGLDHRELQRDVGERPHRVDDAAQVVDVLQRDDAVDLEVDAPAGELRQRAVGLGEGVGADQAVVDRAAAAVERQVDVAQPQRQQLGHHRRVRQHPAVGDQPEVHVAGGDPAGPAHQLGADGRLAARQHHHRVAQGPGAVDLAVDLVGGGVDVADVEGVAEGAVIVAAVADLDQRLHGAPVGASGVTTG